MNHDTSNKAQCDADPSFFRGADAQCVAQCGPDTRAPWLSEAGHHALRIVDLENERLARLAKHEPVAFVP